MGVNVFGFKELEKIVVPFFQHQKVTTDIENEC